MKTGISSICRIGRLSSSFICLSTGSLLHRQTEPRFAVVFQICCNKKKENLFSNSNFRIQIPPDMNWLSYCKFEAFPNIYKQEQSLAKIAQQHFFAKYIRMYHCFENKQQCTTFLELEFLKNVMVALLTCNLFN